MSLHGSEKKIVIGKKEALSIKLNKQTVDEFTVQCCPVIEEHFCDCQKVGIVDKKYCGRGV
jgi:hypothetical protein